MNGASNPFGLLLPAIITLVAGCTAASTNSIEAQEPSGAAVRPMEEGTVAAVPILAAPAETDEEHRAEFWLASDPVQGGVVLARAPSDTVSVMFDGTPLEVEKDGFFLIGFDRDATETASLIANTKDGKQISKTLSVRGGDWRLEQVNAPYRGSARSSEEFQRRRGPELAQINAARAQNNDSIGWRQDFIWPVKGRLSGYFGAQRIYQGKPGSYHSGMDIAAPDGTPFVAPADGVVILAAQSPFTLEGNLLMIDHGKGLNSAFLHCSELLVQTGDVVKQGQIIGRVGSTGRATGPHLHWGMKWNKARVDPKLLLPKT